jgi:hypothetical protein
MKSFKIDDADLTKACANLRKANTTLAEAGKTAEASKTIIRSRLKELRGVDVGTLPIGEIVSVEGLLLVEIGKQNRFDEKQFALDKPALHGEYKKDMPCVKFKPLA